MSWNPLYGKCPSCQSGQSGYFYHPAKMMEFFVDNNHKTHTRTRSYGDICYWVDSLPNKGYIVESSGSMVRCDGCKSEKNIAQWKYKCSKHDFAGFNAIYLEKERLKKENEQKEEKQRKANEQKEIEQQEKVLENTELDLIQYSNKRDLNKEYKTIGKKEVDDILEKNKSSLNETKALLAELTSFYKEDDNDSDDDDEKEIIPQELSGFFTSTKDDFCAIIEAQSELQTTTELLGKIMENKPKDYDTNPDSRKYWDTQTKATETTMNDINIVNELKGKYMNNLIEIGDLMNSMQSEDDVNGLNERIEEMIKAQEKYKKKIMESTQNALAAMGSLMKENVNQQDVEHVSDDIKKYQKLDFKAENELNIMNMNKSSETRSINVEMVHYNKEIGKVTYKLYELNNPVTYSYGGGGGSYSSSSSSSSSSYSSTPRLRRDDNKEKLKAELIRQKEELEQRLKYKKKELDQTAKRWEDKLTIKKQEVKKNKIKFISSVKKLDNIVKKVGVKQEELSDFLELTEQTIPNMMQDQKSMNQLSSKFTGSYSLIKRGLGPQKNLFKIRDYLINTGNYYDYLDQYIVVLSWYKYNFMHQIQCKTLNEFNTKILPILSYHPYYPSNNSGIFGSFSTKNEIKNQEEKLERKEDVATDTKELTRQLLTKWKLEQYIDTLIKNGQDNPNNWNNITEDEFTELGFKKGHIKKFTREFKKWYNKNKSNESQDGENQIIEMKIRRRFQRLCYKNTHWKEYYDGADNIAAEMQRRTKTFYKGFSGVLKKYRSISMAKAKDDKMKIIQKQYILDTFNQKNGIIKCLDNDYNKSTLKVDLDKRKLIQQILETQKNGKKMKKDVYIVVNEAISDNIKSQSIIKAFVK